VPILETCSPDSGSRRCSRRLRSLAATAVAAWHDGATPPIDAGYFADAGGRLFSSGWTHTFANPWLQAGPLELVVLAATRAVGVTQRGWAIVLELSAMGALLGCTATLLGRRAVPLLVVGAGALALGIVGDASSGGHPAELACALLWLLAARSARRGNVARAGALVGIAGCFELWGLLGIAVLLLAPRIRAVLRAAGLAVAIPSLVFLPFAVFGELRMFQHHWVTTGGIDAAILGTGRPFGWLDRLVEAAIVVGAGAAVARRTRGLEESVWIVVAATSLCRLLLDPSRYGYYWDTSLTALLIGAAGAVTARRELAERVRAVLAVVPRHVVDGPLRR
jgi:hypothetical protein